MASYILKQNKRLLQLKTETQGFSWEFFFFFFFQGTLEQNKLLWLLAHLKSYGMCQIT